MTLSEFKSSLKLNTPPAEISLALRALWEDGRGNWDAAHKLAQEVEGKSGAWIHAYLHRKEGDLGNAAYWYRQAGRPAAHDALEEEWDRIVGALIEP